MSERFSVSTQFHWSTDKKNFFNLSELRCLVHSLRNIAKYTQTHTSNHTKKHFQIIICYGAIWWWGQSENDSHCKRTCNERYAFLSSTSSFSLKEWQNLSMVFLLHAEHNLLFCVFLSCILCASFVFFPLPFDVLLHSGMIFLHILSLSLFSSTSRACNIRRIGVGSMVVASLNRFNFPFCSSIFSPIRWLILLTLNIKSFIGLLRTFNGLNVLLVMQLSSMASQFLHDNGKKDRSPNVKIHRVFFTSSFVLEMHFWFWFNRFAFFACHWTVSNDVVGAVFSSFGCWN